ncbi:ECF-type sigma factor [Rheinheimera soli]|uniref:RNA polymerase sigma factor (TIGR02999 family) n=1 Tax=Rheinheimera soli TaxID=443616 RepID=A0ABU1W5Q3_9GAMM|nr:ECF-type sigma factor [Rheinheimera soli]MDR7123160.1 RNA polymerase sigma factor (TIGR02999 family) [Rheinheimera soli]
MNIDDVNEFTQLVNAQLDRLSKSQDIVLSKVYKILRKLAARQLSRMKEDSMYSPTVIVNDMFVKLMTEDYQWSNRRHFVGAFTVSIRNMLVDIARKRLSLKGGGLLTPCELDDVHLVSEQDVEMICSVDDLICKIEKFDPEVARIIELKFFIGLTNEEVADVLGCTRQTVHRKWESARAQIKSII